MLPSLSRRALLDAIAADPLLARVLAHVRSQGEDDPAHDVEHLLRVAQNTLALLDDPSSFRECVCAALLHDVVNLPKNHPERARASALSAAAARSLIEEELGTEATARVSAAIEDHSYSAGRCPRSALGEALQDADRLEALGALGIARTFSTGVRLGARYFHPDDPWSESRPLDDLHFSVDHFFKKLFALPKTLRTERGRAEARERTLILETFLLALGNEIGAPLDRKRLRAALGESA